MPQLFVEIAQSSRQLSNFYWCKNTSFLQFVYQKQVSVVVNSHVSVCRVRHVHVQVLSCPQRRFINRCGPYRRTLCCETTHCTMCAWVRTPFLAHGLSWAIDTTYIIYHLHCTARMPEWSKGVDLSYCFELEHIYFEQGG